MNYNEEECNVCYGIWYMIEGDDDENSALEECKVCKGTGKIIIKED